MNDEQRGEFARLCRQQAKIASTPDARSALTELAEKYEAEAPKDSVAAEPAEGKGEKLE